MPPPLKLPSLNAPLATLRHVLAFNVRTTRVARGLSQERLGFEAGLDRTFVSHVERGRVNCSLDNVEKIALALAVEPAALLVRPRMVMRGQEDGASQ